MRDVDVALKCLCSTCWGQTEEGHLLFSRRMAIIAALGKAGFEATPQEESWAARQFHSELWRQGFEVIKRHDPKDGET